MSPIRLTKQLTLAILCINLLASCGGGGGSSNNTNASNPVAFSTKAALGESLFSDTNLSQDRTQSCATCHNPEHAFIDNRLNNDGVIAAVSTGDDGISQGNRNAPTVAYAHLSPDFHWGSRERLNSQQSAYNGFLGGQFLDGRETDLKGQAGGPPLNPLEMAMPDKASVVVRLLENPDYVESFKALYGENIFESVDAAYDAMTDSIAEFEKTDVFSPFDSKYDLSLKGQATLTIKESFGRALFFSQTDTNCATCHQLKLNSSKTEPFTSYEYHNIGVPANTSLTNTTLDEGLKANPDVDDLAELGKFKVPTLRNVAVTEPYMHNGVFQDLETVIKFYDHFHASSEFTINPETNEPWRAPEFESTVNFAELQDGDPLNQEKVEALVCFLRTLTDARYEHLIQEKGINCDS